MNCGAEGKARERRGEGNKMETECVTYVAYRL